MSLGDYLIPVKLQLARPLVDLAKLRLSEGMIHYFLYQQDGTRQPMSCRDTAPNRIIVAWMQIHDSPLTGRSVEELERRKRGQAA